MVDNASEMVRILRVYAVITIFAAAVILSGVAAFVTLPYAIAQGEGRECGDFRGLTVLGDDFNDAVKKGCPIKATRAVINGNLILNGMTVEAAEFMGAQFNGFVGFSTAQFPDGANFERANFTGRVTFRDAAFQGEVNFREAVFEHGAVFADAVFQDSADFRITTFQGNRVCIFTGRELFVDFQNARFNTMALFDGSVISSCIDFSNALFNDDASFRAVAFNEDAEFTMATFAKAVDFEQTVLQKGIFLVVRRFWAKLCRQREYRAPQTLGGTM